MRGKKIAAAVFITVLVLAVVFGLRELFAPTPDRRDAVRHPRNAVGIIHVDGVIAAGDGGLFSAGGADQLQEDLRRAKDDDIKALVIRINSPGGSAAASQEIYQEIERVRESGKVVVVSMADMAASGGYMIACAADHIVANPASITGSIGTIMDVSSMEGLYDLLGIEYDVIKSGPHKDALNPGRTLTEEERAIFQDMIDDIHTQFVDLVSERRSLSREDVLTLADGRILTGRQAVDAGLVDQLGNLYDAIDIAAEMADIPGEPQIYPYRTRDFWTRFSMGSTEAGLTQLVPFIERLEFLLR